MTERPILFSGPMVRAILEDRKTQTRRVIKPQPKWIESSGRWWWPIPNRALRRGINPGAVVTASREWHEYLPPRCCPYGEPGSSLWVRETRWRNGGYVATDPSIMKNEGKIPSIFMPKSDCRLWLEVLDVRVERLQEIDETDAIAEGAFVDCLEDLKASLSPYRDQFSILWDDINSKSGHSWESNPWVWVVDFRRAVPE